ncbi:MAG TPA: amidohydrolase, partial [Acidimicrobiales bacterium]|nr:amidohydrolase [Acidimicrobiales bacterium]
MSATRSDRYVLISADCHAGGNMEMYRTYLDPAYRDDFDRWRSAYQNPFRDLQGGNRNRNWDDDRRIGELESDGVVGEVVFPNTVPPFFPTGALVARPPTPDEFGLRLAGIRAHNRWMVDWCAAHPERRAGMAQIFLNDIDE